MIRILVSTILSFSILTASNITAGNAGEILKGSQTSTLSINKFDSAPDAKLSKSESKEFSSTIDQKDDETVKAKITWPIIKGGENISSIKKSSLLSLGILSVTSL